MVKEKRCWICRRTESEVKTDYAELYPCNEKDEMDEGFEASIKWRDKIDAKYFPGNGPSLDEGEVIRHVDTEYNGTLPVPLCVICQSIIQAQAGVLVMGIKHDGEIERRLEEGE